MFLVDSIYVFFYIQHECSRYSKVSEVSPFSCVWLLRLSKPCSYWEQPAANLHHCIRLISDGPTCMSNARPLYSSINSTEWVVTSTFRITRLYLTTTSTQHDRQTHSPLVWQGTHWRLTMWVWRHEWRTVQWLLLEEREGHSLVICTVVNLMCCGPTSWVWAAHNETSRLLSASSLGCHPSSTVATQDHVHRTAAHNLVQYQSSNLSECVCTLLPFTTGWGYNHMTERATPPFSKLQASKTMPFRKEGKLVKPGYPYHWLSFLFLCTTDLQRALSIFESLIAQAESKLDSDQGEFEMAPTERLKTARLADGLFLDSSWL